MNKLPPVPLLREMFENRTVTDRSGNSRSLHSEIHPKHAWALYEVVRRARPKTVIEIGMAFGVSTLSILCALKEADCGGRLISIDPGQCVDYDGLGLFNVERAGFSNFHSLVLEPSYIALPSLMQEKIEISVGYIDGWHTFDYVLLDFFYLDAMLSDSGIIGFNDCGYPSIRKVLNFVKTHRKYEEIDVGLKRDYQGRNLLYTAARIALGMRREDRYFQKLRNWEPDWDFFRQF